MSNNFKEPTTQFEAWAWLARDRTIKGVALRGLMFQLIGFWNSEKGMAYPSRATLMEATGIKSKDTLRSLVDQLILGGHLAVVERPGKQSHYYPMMVKNANKKLLAKSQQEVRERLAGKKTASKENKVATKPEGVADEATSDTAVPEVAGIDHRFGSWVKTDADLAIANEYEAVLVQNTEDPTQGDPTGFPVLTVISDVASTGLTDMNSKPRYVVAGSVPMPTNALPGRWVETWGANYVSKSFSLSQIADVYEELLAKTFAENLPYSTVHEVDVAMMVLGQDGRFVPSQKVVDALRYAPELDDRMSKLRIAYQETLRARELCYEHILRGNYDTPTAN